MWDACRISEHDDILRVCMYELKCIALIPNILVRHVWLPLWFGAIIAVQL